MHEFLQTRYATQFHRLGQRAVRPQPAVSNAGVDVVLQGTSTANFLRCQLLDGTIFFPAQMQTLGRDLFQMYFHELTLQISLAKFPTERFGYTPRNKGRDIPAEPGDFLYDARAEIS